jgi:hypothetical protein
VDNIEAGITASLWADRQTGRLFILSSPSDTNTFQRRLREGAFVDGCEFMCEVCEPQTVAAVQRLNTEAEGCD